MNETSIDTFTHAEETDFEQKKKINPLFSHQTIIYIIDLIFMDGLRLINVSSTIGTLRNFANNKNTKT